MYFNLYTLDRTNLGGFLSNDEGITHTNAKYYISNIVDLGGVFTFSDNGEFTYTRGDDTGPASFNYTYVDYDGAGGTDTGTVTVTVE